MIEAVRNTREPQLKIGTTGDNMTTNGNNKTPSSMDITIPSALSAIQYWLNEAVLQDDVTVTKVEFVNSTNVFRIHLIKEKGE